VVLDVGLAEATRVKGRLTDGRCTPAGPASAQSLSGQPDARNRHAHSLRFPFLFSPLCPAEQHVRASEGAFGRMRVRQSTVFDEQVRVVRQEAMQPTYDNVFGRIEHACRSAWTYQAEKQPAAVPCQFCPHRPIAGCDPVDINVSHRKIQTAYGGSIRARFTIKFTHQHHFQERFSKHSAPPR